MALADHTFSDIILLPHDVGRLKGCPDTDQKLVPIPADCLDEVRALRRALPEEFMRKRVSPLQQSSEQAEVMLDEESRGRSIHIVHEGIHYRAAATLDVSNNVTFFLRRLPKQVPAMEKLGLPPHLVDWLIKPKTLQGLVLITGAQASGKTTTAAALVAARLARWGGHGLTLECPAEMPLGGAWGEFGFCVQTEIGSEHELAKQIECAHRFSSPNVILIGEIRTKVAAAEALRVAMGSSRQVVIATAFGLNLFTALAGLLKGAKEIDGASAAHNLASCLLCVIHQDLKSTESGKILSVPQHLLVPFSTEGGTIRAKIREGHLMSLQDDIHFQNSLTAYPVLP